MHTIRCLPSAESRQTLQLTLEALSIPYQEVLPPKPGHLDLGTPGSIVLYASDSEQAQRYIEALQTAGVEDFTVEVSPFSVTDWVEQWKEFYEWVRISARLAVGPPFKLCPFDVPHKVFIEPGQGFGTGTHESTRLALGFLDTLLAPGMSLLDAGCGSGILSIAARKLGCPRVFGFDIEREAVEESRENASFNGAPFDVALGSTETIQGTYDVVVANMLHFRLLPLRHALMNAVEPGGTLVLSGLLVENLPDFIPQFFDGVEPFETIERRHMNDWWSVAFRKGRS